MNAPKLINIRRLPTGELRVFIRDLIEGRIFTSAHISRRTDQEWLHDMPLVFLPLALGEWATAPKPEQIGACYAYHSAACGGGSVNGYPVFLECRWLHREDWLIALAAWHAARVAIDATTNQQMTEGTP